MQLDVLNIEGKSTGRSVDLPDNIFGAEPNDHLIYLAVKQYRAAKHMGNHKVKTRAEANGSSKKLHRQKGTGGARKGNLRNPLYKGGGTVFGPTPRLYTFKINKKEKDMARISAFSYKAKENNIKVLESVSYDAPRTKNVVELLANFELTGKKVLFIVDGQDDNFYLSTRNIDRIKVCQLSDSNTYDIVNANTIILSEDAAKVFNQEEENEEVEA